MGVNCGATHNGRRRVSRNSTSKTLDMLLDMSERKIPPTPTCPDKQCPGQSNPYVQRWKPCDLDPVWVNRQNHLSCWVLTIDEALRIARLMVSWAFLFAQPNIVRLGFFVLRFTLGLPKNFPVPVPYAAVAGRL